MNETDQLIKVQFEKLPKELQEVLNVFPWKTLVKEIATLNNLPPEQAKVLETETMLILYGFEPVGNYGGNLTRELGISEDRITSIIKSVDQKIFGEIEKKMSEPKHQVPSLSPENLPMIEPGEVAHEVTHVEQGVKNETTNDLQPTRPTSNRTTDNLQPTTETQKQNATATNPVSTKIPEPTPTHLVSEHKYPGGVDPYREPIE